MFILSVHWDVRLVWAVLTLTAKFYILCLLAGAARTTYFLAGTVFRLRRLQKNGTLTNTARVKRSLVEMTRRIENLRQFHILLFLLFGYFSQTKCLP
jgi:hypothetical protein